MTLEEKDSHLLQELLTLKYVHFSAAISPPCAAAWHMGGSSRAIGARPLEHPRTAWRCASFVYRTDICGPYALSSASTTCASLLTSAALSIPLTAR